ncbi:MAG: elongator complex protein 3 [Flavobacteriales bacterium]|jgi:elongator complex protein 3
MTQNTTGIKKPTRTISGVAPIAVMLPPRGCNHGACTYCPTLNAPQSYTPDSPAVIRARKFKYDAYGQVKNRVDMLADMGHPVDKIELIIMGGTFLEYPRKFQYEFIKQCYNALNGSSSVKLAEAIAINETADRRCVALCIETRPDVLNDEQINDILKFGATRVELGIQMPDDAMYKLTNRCHTVADAIAATEKIKKAGFKLGYHIMPGLETSNIKKDMKMFKMIFGNKGFKPDQIKIYPCQVIKGAALADKYYKGRFVPYDKEQTADVIIRMIKKTPRYCRIMRIMRAIPSEYLIAGITNLDMRKDIEEVIREDGTKINEIRFREIGFALKEGRYVHPDTKMKTTKYKASSGTEFFLEIINRDNILFGLGRLRLEKDKKIPAMIRELHVYGQASKIGAKDKDAAQHKGFGRQIVEEAENIARKKGYKQIRIISGVGVREYYRKFGYETDDEGIYMIKDL